VNEAGDTIQPILTAVPGTGESIGGLKVVTDDEWLAVRPSGIEGEEGSCRRPVRLPAAQEQREPSAPITLDLLDHGSAFHVRTARREPAC
jgi:hypothetical protein